MRDRLATIVPVAVGVAVVLTSAGSSAPVAFPGANGKLVLGGIDSVRLMNPDGLGSTTIRAQGGAAPVWSADGRWLAYSSNRDPWTLRVMRADGSEDREVLSARAGEPPMHNAYAWSPTGAEIAYQCSAGLCAVRVEDGATRQVLSLSLSTGETVRPTWSPDGTKIAFQCRVRFSPELCLVGADGSDAVVFLLPTGVPTGFPDWSPDGSRILLSGGTVLDVDDGEVRDVSDLAGRGRWSPDGRSIAIWSSGNGTVVVPLDGGQPAKVTDAMFSDWGTSPAVTVLESRLEPRWLLSRQAGRLHLRGVASHAATLSVAVRTPSRTHPASPVSVPAGEYSVSTRLPPDLLPGGLEVVVSGTSESEPLVTVVRAESLAGPATGLVSRSWASVTRRGAPRARVPRGTKTLFAQFAFSLRPATGQRLHAVWLAPSGSVHSSTRVPSATIVSAGISSDAGLARGRWRCRLDAGGTALAIASVRVG